MRASPPWPPAQGSKAWPGVVALLLVGVLASGCGDRVEVPEGLLSEETVGGTATEDIGGYLRNASRCGLDGDSSLIGADTGGATIMGYRRTGESSGGEGSGGRSGVGLGAQGSESEEMVVIWVREQRRGSTEDGFELLAGGLDSPDCQAPPAIDARRVPVDHPDAVAFAAVSIDQYGRRVSIMRSYTQLEPAQFEQVGQLVMVSIQATGPGDPSVEELNRLTTTQIERTQSTQAAPAPRDHDAGGVQAGAAATEYHQGQ